MSVSEASSIVPTATMKPGAMLRNDPRSESASATIAAITTRPDDVIASPTRCTDVRSASCAWSPARSRSR